MFYIKECGDFIVSLNIGILEKPWKSIKVTLFHGIFVYKKEKKLQKQNLNSTRSLSR